MTHIRERRVVRCSDREAPQYLAALFADHEHADGSVSVSLRLSNLMLADRQPVLERRFVATLHALAAIGDAHPTYSVTWQPQEDDRCPHFAGALAVEKSRRDGCFSLILSGDCDPPAAAPGAVYDADIGSRIAHAAARALLRWVADHVEHARAHSEAALAGHRPVADRVCGWIAPAEAQPPAPEQQFRSAPRARR